MKFEDEANTTATRMYRSAKAAFRRGDLARLREILEKAEDYKDRLHIRCINARNTTHYHLGYENDAANASHLCGLVEGLLVDMEVARGLRVRRPEDGHCFCSGKSFKDWRAVAAACTPWAEVIKPVEGGWEVFESRECYEDWNDHR